MTRRTTVYPATGAADLAAYDDLPPAVRAKVRAADAPVAAIPLRRFWTAEPGARGAAREAALLRALDLRFPEVAA
ncbi:DUF6525 family protein [Brevundimonas naejangsanensis]